MSPVYRGEDKPSPYELAGFYASSYPDTDPNEKADMLYAALKRAGWDCTIVEKERTVKDKEIFWNGKQLWPVEYKENAGTVDALSDSLEQTASDLDELGDRFENKKCEGGQCGLPANK